MEKLEQIHVQMRELERKRKESTRKIGELWDKTSGSVNSTGDRKFS